MNCAIHNKPMRQGKFGYFCPTKMDDGSWCKYKGVGNSSPRAVSEPTQAPKEQRNWDREAYEKCCSIWAAAHIESNQGHEIGERLRNGEFWRLFQSIREDGEKRFATGWQKAEATFRPAPTQTPSPRVISDDLEAGNRAVSEAQAEEQDPTIGEGIDF